ncbi:MAG: hypothetical protein FJ398_03595 [Verrucomicrobia bacterium]|nr:hypothetical protein [Verrucomicrobiota bacterium]
MRKFLLTSGPLSQRTILGNAGFDVEEGSLVDDPKCIVDRETHRDESVRLRSSPQLKDCP